MFEITSEGGGFAFGFQRDECLEGFVPAASPAPDGFTGDAQGLGDLVMGAAGGGGPRLQCVVRWPTTEGGFVLFFLTEHANDSGGASGCGHE